MKALLAKIKCPASILLLFIIIVRSTNLQGADAVIQESTATPWYEYINQIPDGSTILFSPMYGLSDAPTLLPMTVATIHQLWSKNVKIIVVSFWAEGPLVFAELLQQIDPSAAPYNKIYGEDWINLGYIPGAEVAMAALSQDILSVAPKDYFYKKDTASYPMMANIKDASNINLIINIDAGTPGTLEWIRQWQIPYGTPIFTGCSDKYFSNYMPFLQSGQVSAMLSVTSIKAYEILLGLAAKTTTSITCKSNMTNPQLGQSITISGSISPPVSNAQVEIVYISPSGASKNYTVYTDSNGYYQDTFSPNAAATWTVRVSWEGDENFQGSSYSLQFVVSPKPQSGIPGFTIESLFGGLLLSLIIWIGRKSRVNH